MTQQTLDVDPLTADQLNEIGSGGWELLSILAVGGGHYQYIFKRPDQTDDPPVRFAEEQPDQPSRRVEY